MVINCFEVDIYLSIGEVAGEEVVAVEAKVICDVWTNPSYVCLVFIYEVVIRLKRIYNFWVIHASFVIL